MKTQERKKITLFIPNVDMNMLKMLSKKMGWKIQTTATGINEAIDDLKAGRITVCENFEDYKEKVK